VEFKIGRRPRAARCGEPCKSRSAILRIEDPQGPGRAYRTLAIAIAFGGSAREQHFVCPGGKRDRRVVQPVQRPLVMAPFRVLTVTESSPQRLPSQVIITHIALSHKAQIACVFGPAVILRAAGAAASQANGSGCSGLQQLQTRVTSGAPVDHLDEVLRGTAALQGSRHCLNWG
jgi:hypothetical protein